MIYPFNYGHEKIRYLANLLDGDRFLVYDPFCGSNGMYDNYGFFNLFIDVRRDMMIQWILFLMIVAAFVVAQIKAEAEK